MTLIKSKINPLAWLKSAIYISVVGGVILSSTRVLAATPYFVLPATDQRESFSITVRQDEFEGKQFNLVYPGINWIASFMIDEDHGGALGYDNLSINVVLQHLTAPHPGENGRGKVLNLDFNNVTSINQNGGPKIVEKPDWEFHSGTRGHVDNADGTLTAYLINNLNRTSDIDRWTLKVEATHGVPEPLTMLGAATALGYGALLKRKYSENKKS